MNDTNDLQATLVKQVPRRITWLVLVASFVGLFFAFYLAVFCDVAVCTKNMIFWGATAYITLLQVLVRVFRFQPFGRSISTSWVNVLVPFFMALMSGSRWIQQSQDCLIGWLPILLAFLGVGLPILCMILELKARHKANSV